MSLFQSKLVDLMGEVPKDKDTDKYNQWTHKMTMAATQCSSDYDMSKNISSCPSYLNIYNQAFEVNTLLGATDVIKFLGERHSAESDQENKLTDKEKKLLNNLREVLRKLHRKARDQENPNVRTLCENIRDMFKTEGEDSRAMVFVKTRATCKALTKYLGVKLIDVGKTSALYGQERRGNEEGMTQDKQNETVEKFRKGVYKVIVATSIGTEGIDIPECNMSLNYNYIGNEVTKVQTKGRIRKPRGKHITMLLQKDLEKERLSVYKEAMMQRALISFEKLRPTEIEMKIKLNQQKEIANSKFRRELENYKKQRKTDEGDYEILCKNCGTPVCYISDVRTIGPQHIVIDRTFEERINTRRHNKPQTFDGFNKNRKMYCNKCPLDWGVVAEKGGLDYTILKLGSLKLVDMVTKSTTTYKKWIDVPYKIPEMTSDDLKRLMGDATE